jgi:acyl-ACP thioesterase
MTLAKVLIPVLDGHPGVFEHEWPLRVADIDRDGRLRLDAAARHIQDIGHDQLRELGFEDTHPLWIFRRTMINLIKPIEFNDRLRLRRWCSATSTRWCEKRVRIDGRKGGLIESEAFWININPDTLMPSRINDGFLEGLHATTNIHRQVRTRTDRPNCHHAHIRQRRRDQGHRIHLYPVAIAPPANRTAER